MFCEYKGASEDGRDEKKKIVIALGHEALGTTLPEQKEATKRTAKAVADFIREDYQVVITHSNGPQIGMIHTAMNEFVNYIRNILQHQCLYVLQ